MTAAFHHVGLATDDIERATAFYVDALGGRILTRPLLEWAIASEVMGGPAGTRFRHCLVGFDGGALELFEFVGPDMPDWARRRDERRLPHLAMRVDDVDAALERVERAGGRRLWPAPRSAGGIGNVYVADPDGNVLELIDAAIEAIAAATIAAAPESDPRIGRERDRG